MKLDYLKLKSIIFDKENDITIIGKDSENIFSYEDPNNIIIKIAEYLDGNNTIKDISNKLLVNNIKLGTSDIENIIIDVFINNDLILNNFNQIILSNKQLIKYDRLIHFFASYKDVDYLKAQKMQQKLINSNILILGVGGTGGHTAHSLIASGVSNMTLLDFDNIELTNVTRQMLYSENDIGKPKIKIAKEKLLDINPEAKITILNEEIKNKKQIQKIISDNNFDFVVNTMDNPRGKIRYIIDDALYDSNIPYIYDGSAGSDVFVGPLIKKDKTKRYSDLIKDSPNNNEINKLNDKIYITNVIEPLNGTVGQLTAFEVIKYLTNCSNLSTLGTRVKLNMDSLEINKYEL